MRWYQNKVSGQTVRRYSFFKDKKIFILYTFDVVTNELVLYDYMQKVQTFMKKEPHVN